MGSLYWNRLSSDLLAMLSNSRYELPSSKCSIPLLERGKIDVEDRTENFEVSNEWCCRKFKASEFNVLKWLDGRQFMAQGNENVMEIVSTGAVA